MVQSWGAMMLSGWPMVGFSSPEQQQRVWPARDCPYISVKSRRRHAEAMSDAAAAMTAALDKLLPAHAPAADH